MHFSRKWALADGGDGGEYPLRASTSLWNPRGCPASLLILLEMGSVSCDASSSWITTLAPSPSSPCQIGLTQDPSPVLPFVCSQRSAPVFNPQGTGDICSCPLFQTLLRPRPLLCHRTSWMKESSRRLLRCFPRMASGTPIWKKPT